MLDRWKVNIKEENSEGYMEREQSKFMMNYLGRSMKLLLGIFFINLVSQIASSICYSLPIFLLQVLDVMLSLHMNFT
jgi:flagellar biosynthesis protein FlhB